ncbi:MAG: hypothetical protein WD059_13290 [Balneolaceae bacterium]
MKKLLLLSILSGLGTVSAQDSISNTQIYWESLEALCGNAYSGEVLEAPADDSFREQELVMHVRSCEENQIRIPFFVGDDRSRTWVLTLEDDRILLKHDHRHEDGSEDEVTQYGGYSTNTGLATLQTFPADQETAELIPAAASNIWWIEVVKDEYFTYNLRRIGTDRYFSIRFNFSEETETPEAPWGWEDN